ncbi:MAG TPA: hypothetical protein VMR21_14310 [Vicinamibacteria bacterium]|nr:hypothetical protein [Vicinamibacteria bacterium]
MIPLALLLALAVATQAEVTTTARVKETAYARVALAQKLARDPALRKAIAASNAKGEPLDLIRRRDVVWVANPRDPLRQAVVQAPCSERLRELVKDDALVVEAFAMNALGALVCSVAETSDYWQGDEPKWQRTFVEGKEAVVEEPAFDASSGTYAIQVSVPTLDEGRRTGALTLTLKLQRTPRPPSPRP